MEKRAAHFKETLAALKLRGIRAQTLRLDRMISMVNHLERHHSCQQCQSLLNEAEKWAATTHPDNNMETFESSYLDIYGRILTHLKEDHRLLMPGHYRNLYALIMMLVGACAGALIVYMGRSSSMGNWSYETGLLLGWIIGLLTGMITGHNKDRHLKKNNQLLFE